jgi:hypothetical protein
VGPKISQPGCTDGGFGYCSYHTDSTYIGGSYGEACSYAAGCRTVWSHRTTHNLCFSQNPNVCSGSSTTQADVYTGMTVGHQDVEGVACPGGTAVAYDGKCPTGAYTDPITAEEAANRRNLMEGQMPSAKPQIDALASALSDMFTRVPVNIEELDGAPQVQDVANVSGPTTNTTKPDGTTVQTATAWDFKPYGLTKGFGYATSGAWDEQKTTTTCAGGGTQCTTETTTTTQDDSPTAEGDDPERDFCKDYPNRAGCLELGDPPADEIPRRNENIAWTPETINLPAGCPAPFTFSVLGQSYQLSYAIVCDWATRIKPFVLALGLMSALMIVVAALGGNRGSA